MTQEYFLAGNKIIGQFHGWQQHKTEKGNPSSFWSFPEWGRAQFNVADLMYHKSWEWLMPIVEKIERMGYIVQLTVCLSGSCRIWNHKETLAFSQGNTLINATYTACLQFIEKYNSRKAATGEKEVEP